MAITKSQPTKTNHTPLARATAAMKKFREIKRKQDALNEEKKELEAELFELAEEHPEWFEKTKTVTLDEYGKIAYVSESKIIYDADKYDEKAFYNRFPACVKLAPQVSAIKGLCIDENTKRVIETSFGISLRTEDVFRVTPNK